MRLNLKSLGTRATKTGRTVSVGRLRLGTYKPSTGGPRLFRAWRRK